MRNGYDEAAAVAYAKRWAMSRNPAYLDFHGLGGDCTNFVSQCLYAGAGIMNRTPVYGWYYLTGNNRTASWTGVEYLYRFLTANKGAGPYAQEVSQDQAGPGDVVQLGDRSVDLHDALVTLPDGTTLALTATERTLLRKLAENRGHIVTYDALCEAVWGADYYGYENSLGVHIRHLREKLEPEPGRPRFLQTVRGIGYKLAKEDAR